MNVAFYNLQYKHINPPLLLNTRGTLIGQIAINVLMIHG